MSERRTGTRAQEHEIVIDAPIESVWKAIMADGEELTPWLFGRGHPWNPASAARSPCRGTGQKNA